MGRDSERRTSDPLPILADPAPSANRGAIGNGLPRLLDVLASGRLAIVLMATLSALLLVYLLVPQVGGTDAATLERWVETSGMPARLARAAGLTDVQHSWLLFGTYALLFINLLVCMARRFRPAIHRLRFPETPPAVSPNWLHREIHATGLAAESAAKTFRNKGYRTLVTGDTVYGLRGRFATLGHWVFHVSFLVLIAGGAWIAGAPEPFRGTVGIGEGETFDLHVSPFLSTKVPPPASLPPLRFLLEKIDVRTEGDEVQQVGVQLSTPEGDPTAMGINRPYRRRPYQVMLHGFGFMPGWVVIDKRGRMVGGAWVKLVPFPLQEEDSFSIGRGESTVSVRFFPDHQADGEGIRDRSHELRNPRFEARVVWRGKQVFDGLLKPDERVPLANGMEFFFLPEIRKYGMLDVMQERGYEIIFASLAAMILGLVIRYARLRKEVLIHVEEESSTLFGRSEILENLFAEELDRLAAELAKVSFSARNLRETI